MTRPSTAREGTPRQLLVFAAIFAAVGAELTWASYTRQPALRVPPTIGYLVAAVALAGSAAAAAKASGRPRLVEILAVLILVGFTAIGDWIAFGDSGVACTTNAPLWGAARLTGCRVAFGIGAVISGAMAIWAAALAWSRSAAHDRA
jgi:hypothetical protein